MAAGCCDHSHSDDHSHDHEMMEEEISTSVCFLKMSGVRQGAQGLLDPPMGAASHIKNAVLVEGDDALVMIKSAGSQLPPTVIASLTKQSPNAVFDFNVEGAHFFSVEGSGVVNIVGNWEYHPGALPDGSPSDFLNSCIVVQTPVEESVEEPVEEPEATVSKSSLGAQLKKQQKNVGADKATEKPAEKLISPKDAVKAALKKASANDKSVPKKDDTKKVIAKEGEKGFRGEIRGVTYEVISAGSLDKPKVQVNSKLRVRYAGKLKKNGKQFDKGSLSFRVGAGEMIPGFDAGVRGMHPNEVRRILIPAKLGYGNQRTGPIPPGSDLIFDVTVVDCQN